MTGVSLGINLLIAIYEFFMARSTMKTLLKDYLPGIMEDKLKFVSKRDKKESTS